MRAIAYEQKVPLRGLVCAGLNAVFAQHRKPEIARCSVSESDGAGDVEVGRSATILLGHKRQLWPNMPLAKTN